MTLHPRMLAADIFNFIFRPKRYAASATLPMRDLYHKLFKTIFFREVHYRAQLSDKISESPLFSMPEDKGYLKIENIDEALKSDVLIAAKKLLKEKLTPEYIKSWENAPFVVVPIKDDLTSKNPFLKFALQKSLLRSLANYFGILPVIENITIWYSPNEKNLAGSSQYYHLDGQDVKTVQLFLYIEDVELENGPLVVVEAKRSVEIAREIGYRKNKILKRVDDEFMKSQTDPGQIVHAVGKAGDCYAVDTDRCFHFGSRKASKPRFLVVFQYYTPFSFVLPWRWWHKLPFAKIDKISEFNDIERAVLGAKS